MPFVAFSPMDIIFCLVMSILYVGSIIFDNSRIKLSKKSLSLSISSCNLSNLDETPF